MNPEPDHGALDEIRAVLDAPPGEAERADRARLEQLLRISDDPCHQATFDRLTAARILRITVYGLLEAGDWPRAARYSVTLDRLERQDTRQPHAPMHAPLHTPVPAPASASAVPAAPRSARELYFELKHARRAMQRERAAQRQAPRHPQPQTPATKAPSPPSPSEPAPPSTRLPFT